MLDKLKEEDNVTLTENAAVAYNTTTDSLVDFFAQGGALRNRDEKEITSLFDLAYSEDALLALKCLFYFRDIRGGQGERNTFRIILKHLTIHHKDTMLKNIKHIPEFGRWDDLYTFVGTKLEKEALDLMKEKFNEDMKSDTPSLLGKWLKSENTSSKESIRLAIKTREHFDLTSAEYRRSLSKLRKLVNVVERKMSANDWDKIEYSAVPSLAGIRYKKAFSLHDADRYTKFIQDVKEGKTSIKTATLYPYDIIQRILDRGDTDEALEVMWNNLPDYIEKEENSIAVIDTSGSMMGLPISVAVSLGMYLAERNKGAFHNHFITFSRAPKLQEIIGSNLYNKVHNLSCANWDMNTNIEAVFNLLLSTALKHKMPQKEMVKKLYIISDMEFDNADRAIGDEKLFETIKREWKAHNYDLPKVVFWNVDARNKQFPTKVTDSGVQLVSGCSPVIFKNLMKDKFMTPFELMMDVITNERYNCIEV